MRITTRALFASLTSITVVALSLASARSARAQAAPGITGIDGTVQLLDPDGSTYGAQPAGVPANVIDLAECDADVSYAFTLGVANPSTEYLLNAWVGTQDCTVLANRLAATAVCWPVRLPNVAVTNPSTVEVRAQDIVSQAWSTSHQFTYSAATSAVCSGHASPNVSDLVLYFFFVDDDGNAVGTEQSYPFEIDLNAQDGGVAESGSEDASTDSSNGDTGGGGGGGEKETANCSVARGAGGNTGGALFGFGVATVIGGAGLARRRTRARRMARA